MKNTQAQTAPVVMVHGMLIGGILILAAVFAGLTAAGVVPMIRHDRDVATTTLLAEIFGGLQLVILAVAVLVFKPRIPGRTAAQSVQAYWASQETISRVLPVWFLCDGAAILGIVAYGLTGHVIPAAVAGLALVACILLSPGRIAG